MKIIYWIKANEGWQMAKNRKEFENFSGEKCILPSFQSPMWVHMANDLLQYR